MSKDSDEDIDFTENRRAMYELVDFETNVEEFVDKDKTCSAQSDEFSFGQTMAARDDFVEQVRSTTDDAFKIKVDTNGPQSIEALPLARHCKRMREYLSLRSDKHQQSAWGEAFLNAAKDVGILAEDNSTSLDVFRGSITIQLAELYNKFVAALRARVCSREFVQSIVDREKYCVKNYIGVQRYIDALFLRFSRLNAIRVDVGYTLISRSKVTIAEVREDLNHLLRNKRTNSLFKNMVGYVWKLEHGNAKGYHVHLLVFYNGSKRHKDAYLANELGKYWVKLTQARGNYFNCNQSKQRYRRLGIGMIDHTNWAARNVLVNVVVRYMFKKDQYFKINIYDGGKSFSRGLMPVERVHGAGRPRKSALSVACSLGAYAKIHSINSDTEESDADGGDSKYIEPCKADDGSRLAILLGQDVDVQKDVYWLPGQQGNGIVLLLGSSGSGKTEVVKIIVNGVYKAGYSTLVLDFHGDIATPGLRTVVLTSAVGSVEGLNPMELDSYSANEVGLYDQRKALVDMIRRAVPKMGHRQSDVLRDAIEEAYAYAGIMDTDPATWKRSPPTFATVQGILRAWAIDERWKSQRQHINGCLAVIRDVFDHPLFNRKVHLCMETMLSSGVRIDLSKLSDDVRYIVAETLLRKVFRTMKLKGPIPVQPANDREKFRLFIAIDEAKILSTGKGDPNAHGSMLNVLATEGRKFGIGLILASQMADHFGQEVKANAATWLVLKPMDAKEGKKNAVSLGLPVDALATLKGKGDGFLRDGSPEGIRRVQIQRLPSFEPLISSWR